MSWCSSYTKALNFRPKENSKTQIKKAEYLKNNPTTYICCEKCGKHNITLYKNKNDKKYYCQDCK